LAPAAAAAGRRILRLILLLEAAQFPVVAFVSSMFCLVEEEEEEEDVRRVTEGHFLPKLIDIYPHTHTHTDRLKKEKSPSPSFYISTYISFLLLFLSRTVAHTQILQEGEKKKILCDSFRLYTADIKKAPLSVIIPRFFPPLLPSLTRFFHL
jgi:hypothetical protein